MLNCNGHLCNAFQTRTHKIELTRTLKLNTCIHSQRRTPNAQDADLEPGSNSQIQKGWYHCQTASDVPIGGCLGHSDHKVVIFKIWSDGRKIAIKTLTLDTGRADSSLLRKLVIKVPWETAFQGTCAHQYQSLFN